MISNTTGRTSHTTLAGYARYSTDMQRPASIEDQQRNCFEAAEKRGWTVLVDHLYADKGASGQTLKNRPEFNRLVELATSGEAPFHGIIADDTSRFARNMSDFLPIVDQILYAGIFLYFANKKLHSDDDNFRALLVLSAQADEAHSVQLAEKVHRGMRGRVLKGYLPNGRPYGYRCVDVPSPNSRVGVRQTMVEGVDLSIYEPEAEIVRRMFQMSADGIGYSMIARTFQKEGVPSTRSHMREEVGQWHAQTVKRMLNNPKYKGMHVWNKTTQRINPKEHTKEMIARPDSEWECIQNEKWRIVPDSLWEAAGAGIKARAGKHAGPSAGGLARWRDADNYVFSGLLRCSYCGGSMRLFSNRANSRRYMCTRALRWAQCTHRDSIHLTAVQARLLSVLKTATTNGLEEAISREIRKGEREELFRRLNSLSISDLETSRNEIIQNLGLLYGRGPTIGYRDIYQDKVNGLEKHASELKDALRVAHLPTRDILTDEEAALIAKELVQAFASALENEGPGWKDRVQSFVQPMQVSWEENSNEKMACIMSALQFWVHRANKSLTLPFRTVISANSRTETQKAVAVDWSSLGWATMTVSECARAVGKSSTVIYKWCHAGLKHHRVDTANTRSNKGSIRIEPLDLQSWMKTWEISASKIEFLSATTETDSLEDSPCSNKDDGYGELCLAA